jgi:hypothetical protein
VEKQKQCLRSKNHRTIGLPLQNAEFYKGDLKCEIYGEVENVAVFNMSAERI